MNQVVLHKKARDDLQAVIAAVRSADFTDLPIDVQLLLTAKRKLL